MMGSIFTSQIINYKALGMVLINYLALLVIQLDYFELLIDTP